jgi:leader peptidase (prepilin peptidase)/N-methyltransferase
MATTSNYLHSFVIGVCIGSFLNVVVYRLQNELSIIKPRSFCPKCKTQLTWRENIPLISYLIQRGKCVNCNVSIPLRYPLIEFITGILFAVFVKSSPTFYGISSNLSLNIFFGWLFLSLLICISLIDISSFWIPQSLITFGLYSGLLKLLIYSSKYTNLNLFFKGISTSAIAFLIFESLRYTTRYIFRKDAIGKGDSKLVAVLALWLGPIGTLFAVGISYIIASIYCLVGLSMNLIRFRQVIPFAPFLSLGGLIIWFFGNEFIFEKILRI